MMSIAENASTAIGRANRVDDALLGARDVGDVEHAALPARQR